jgi:hypothetical protein
MERSGSGLFADVNLQASCLARTHPDASIIALACEGRHHIHCIAEDGDTMRSGKRREGNNLTGDDESHLRM